MIRSVLAVAGGLAVILVVVVLGTALASLALVGPGGEITPAYLSANLVVSLAAALLGGWVVGRAAPGRPLAHALALAGVLVLMAIPALISPGEGQAAWYPWVVMALGVSGAAAGGALASRGRDPAPVPGSVPDA